MLDGNVSLFVNNLPFTQYQQLVLTLARSHEHSVFFFSITQRIILTTFNSYAYIYFIVFLFFFTGSTDCIDLTTDNNSDDIIDMTPQNMGLMDLPVVVSQKKSDLC